MLSWTKEYCWLVCCVLFSEHLSISSSPCLPSSVCVCVYCVAAQMRSSSSSSSSSYSLLHTADKALISLVWSSQMEPEHDLFPGETVCFPCPACTKSHIVPLPISHAESPLQVLGYLADGGSDFRNFFFFFLTHSQEYGILFSTLPPNLNTVHFNIVLRLNSSQRIACDSLLCSPSSREEGNSAEVKTLSQSSLDTERDRLGCRDN